MAGIVSLLGAEGLMDAVALQQNKVFEDAVTFAKAEGVVPAPETAHAVSAAMDTARKCKETGEAKNIVFNFSGHGYFDMSAYDSFIAEDLVDHCYSKAEIEEALKCLPEV
jgi:tryptophan synthase beta chain